MFTKNKSWFEFKDAIIKNVSYPENKSCLIVSKTKAKLKAKMCLPKTVVKNLNCKYFALKF